MATTTPASASVRTTTSEPSDTYRTGFANPMFEETVNTCHLFQRKVKAGVCLLRENDRKATERHLPYGITPTQTNASHRNPSQTSQYSIRFFYSGGMKGWVDLSVSYIPRWVTMCGSDSTGNRTHDLFIVRPTYGHQAVWVSASSAAS